MEKTYLREFTNLLFSQKSERELGTFLEAILTPRELKEIPKRLQIVKMLKRGVTQKVISKKLGVGVATVTRGSLEIKKGSFKDIS